MDDKHKTTKYGNHNAMVKLSECRLAEDEALPVLVVSATELAQLYITSCC